MARGHSVKLLGEVGLTHLELPDNMRFSGPGAGLPACGFGTPVTVANGSCQSEGFATDNSWGYRIVGRMDFENVIGRFQFQLLTQTIVLIVLRLFEISPFARLRPRNV